MALSNLVTCLVERYGSGWSVVFVSEGRTPKDFFESSLSAATDRASSEVAALYAGKREAAGAELQFAIYPWRGRAGQVMLDVTRDRAGLAIQDIQGSGISFHSESIDAVVSDAERYVPATNEAMIRWVRRVAGL